MINGREGCAQCGQGFWCDIMSRCRRLHDQNACEVIGTDVIVIDEVLQGPTKLFWACIDFAFAQHKDGDDLVCLEVLLDASLVLSVSNRRCRRCNSRKMGVGF